MIRRCCAVAIMVCLVPCSLWAQKPYNEADFRRMRVIETWQKYGDKLSLGQRAVPGDPRRRLRPERAPVAGVAALGQEGHRQLQCLRPQRRPAPGPARLSRHLGGLSFLAQLQRRVRAWPTTTTLPRSAASRIVHLRKDESATLAEGLQWVIDHHEQYNITAVNLSPVDDKPHAEPVPTAIDAKLKRLRELNIWVSARAGTTSTPTASPGPRASPIASPSARSRPRTTPSTATAPRRPTSSFPPPPPQAPTPTSPPRR